LISNVGADAAGSPWRPSTAARGEVHHRVGVQRGDGRQVARVDAGHCVGVGELPRREILARLVVVVGDVVGRQFGTRGRHR
jgi:hypothetical protein